MMEDLRDVVLCGKLGKMFGKYHKLAVSSTAEAIKALSCLHKGFQRELIESKDRGIAYAVFVGKNNIVKEELKSHSNRSLPIKIVPIVSGSKAGGVLQIVVGAALVVAGVASLVISGATFGTTAPISSALIMMGASMMLGGVVQLLTKSSTGDTTADTSTNYNFSGAVNTSAQGVSVSLLYGRMTVGSTVVSAGIYSQDQ